MSREPDWETPAEEYTHITDLCENIRLLVAAWCEASGREELNRLHAFLRMEEEA